MPRSLEERRRAVIQALRALSADRRTPVDAPTEPDVEPVVDAVVDAVEARLDAVSAQISEVLARLDSVETTLLEAAWEHPPATRQPIGVDAEVEPEPDERVSVPKVPLGEGRMSSIAAEALFGG